MPKNESSRAPDNEIDDAEKEIEDFKRFSVMSKQMLNCPKVVLKKCKMHRILAESVRLQQVTRQADPSDTDKFADTNTKPSTASPTSVILYIPPRNPPIICLIITYLLSILERNLLFSVHYHFLTMERVVDLNKYQKTSIPYHTLIMLITS